MSNPENLQPAPAQETPQIRTVTILVKGNIFEIPALNGKAHRAAPGKAQLGKRYVCGQDLTIETEKEIKDQKTDEIRKEKSKETQYVPGTFPTENGQELYLGCGTEILCIKPSSEESWPECCGIPMVNMLPKVLPSAD